MTDLSGFRLLCFVGDIYEDLELWYPLLRLAEVGVETVLAGPEAITVEYSTATAPSLDRRRCRTCSACRASRRV